MKSCPNLAGGDEDCGTKAVVDAEQVGAMGAVEGYRKSLMGMEASRWEE